MWSCLLQASVAKRPTAYSQGIWSGLRQQAVVSGRLRTKSSRTPTPFSPRRMLFLVSRLLQSQPPLTQFCGQLTEHFGSRDAKKQLFASVMGGQRPTGLELCRMTGLLPSFSWNHTTRSWTSGCKALGSMIQIHAVDCVLDVKFYLGLQSNLPLSSYADDVSRITWGRNPQEVHLAPEVFNTTLDR